MKRALLLLALLLLGGGCSPAPVSPTGRIVLIVIDTLRRDHLSCYGGSPATPHIDGLAASGERFEQAFSAFHQTTMSMGSLFTGRTPSIESPSGRSTLPWTRHTWCGLARFASAADSACIPESLPTLGTQMSQAGYWTIGITSNPLLFEPAGLARGFRDWQEVGVLPRPLPGRPLPPGPVLHTERRSAPYVHAALEAALARRPTDRFFLYLHYMEAHDYRESGLSYAEAVTRADAAVGRLLEILDEAGLREGTTFVLTSDHGERLGERHPVAGTTRHHGNPSFDYLIRVPLIVSPAFFGDGAQTWVRGPDLLPRLLALAGQSAASQAELEARELFLSERRWRTYRAGRWKSFLSRHDDRLLLFDLDRDPGESRDVAAEHPAVAQQHRLRHASLAARLAATGPADAGTAAEDRQLLRALGYAE